MGKSDWFLTILLNIFWKKNSMPQDRIMFNKWLEVEGKELEQPDMWNISISLV